MIKNYKKIIAVATRPEIVVAHQLRLPRLEERSGGTWICHLRQSLTVTTTSSRCPVKGQQWTISWTRPPVNQPSTPRRTPLPQRCDRYRPAIMTVLKPINFQLLKYLRGAPSQINLKLAFHLYSTRDLPGKCSGHL